MAHAYIVTGAASGLGQEVMQHLVANGHAVAGVDLAELTAPEGARAYGCDVTDAAAVDATVAQIVADFGGIAGAVCCAGIAPASKIVGREGAHNPDLFAKVVSVNAIGTFNMLNAAANAMKDNAPDANGQRGAVIMTASIAAFEGQIGQIAYAASKGAVAAMTLPAARELARHGIRVVSIAPGVFDTPMLRGLPQEVQDSIAATIPFPPRLADPADFAALVQHIFNNKTLNGEVIRLDGALRMAGT